MRRWFKALLLAGQCVALGCAQSPTRPVACCTCTRPCEIAPSSPSRPANAPTPRPLPPLGGKDLLYRFPEMGQSPAQQPQRPAIPSQLPDRISKQPRSSYAPQLTAQPSLAPKPAAPAAIAVPPPPLANATSSLPPGWPAGKTQGPQEGASSDGSVIVWVSEGEAPLSGAISPIPTPPQPAPTVRATEVRRPEVPAPPPPQPKAAVATKPAPKTVLARPVVHIGRECEELPHETAGSSPAARATAFGHAADYAWLTGELQYLQTRHAWRLRYAGAGDEDRYGGTVTLTGDALPSGCASGDVVRVEGHLINPDASDPRPTYWVKTIRPFKAGAFGGE